jgi:hypothetical protein
MPNILQPLMSGPNRPKWVLTAEGNKLRCKEAIPAGTFLFRVSVDLFGYHESNSNLLPDGVEGVILKSLAFPIRFADDDASKRVFLTWRMQQDLYPLDQEIDALTKASDDELLAMEVKGTHVVSTASEFIDLTVEVPDESKLSELKKERREIMSRYGDDFATLKEDPTHLTWGFHIDRMASDERNKKMRIDGLLEPDEEDANSVGLVDTRGITDPFGTAISEEELDDYERHASNIRFDPVVYCLIQGNEVAISESDFKVLRAFGHVCYVRCYTSARLIEGDNVIKYVQPRAFYNKAIEISSRFMATRADRVRFDEEWEDLKENNFAEVQINVPRPREAVEEGAAVAAVSFERKYALFNAMLRDYGFEA